MTSPLHRLFGMIVLTVTLWLNPLSAILPDLTTDGTPKVIVQWLQSANDPMTQEDGPGTMIFNPFDGGPGILLQASAPKDYYIGMMCNKLPQYTLTLTANEGVATTNTGQISTAGGAPITFTATLSPVMGTFAAGATPTTTLNLTGSSASGTVNFASTSDLPLQAAAPNVWKLTLSVPQITSVVDGMVMAGTYTGSITVTVSL